MNSYANATEDRPSGEIPGLTPKLGAVAPTVARLETGSPLLLGYRAACGGARGERRESSRVKRSIGRPQHQSKNGLRADP